MTAYGINPPFDGLSRGMGQVGYALLTRAPVVILEEQALPDVTPRLACVKPVASVHPEPGSNSSLFKLFYYPRSGIRYCSPKSYFFDGIDPEN